MKENVWYLYLKHLYQKVCIIEFTNRLIMKLLLFVSALLLVSPLIGQSIYPIEHGNEWRMKFAGQFDQTGETYTISKILDSKKEINGKKYYQIASTVYTTKAAETGFSSTSYSRTDTDGNLVGMTNDKTTEEQMMMPAKLKVDQTWITDQGENKVIDMNASIETPEKTYNGCIAVAINQGGTEMISYTKEGIGPVAITVNGQLMAYLYEYKLN